MELPKNLDPAVLERLEDTRISGQLINIQRDHGAPRRGDRDDRGGRGGRGGYRGGRDRDRGGRGGRDRDRGGYRGGRGRYDD